MGELKRPALPDVLDLSNDGRAFFLGWLESRMESSGRLTRADWREAHAAAMADASRAGGSA